MDDLEPYDLGYRVMDDTAFEITRRTMREKVDAFLKEKNLHPTGQERANLYRINYYHMLFWMMAQPVADPVDQKATDEMADAVKSDGWDIDWALAFTRLRDWVASKSWLEWVGIACVWWLFVSMLGDMFGKR